MTRVAGVRSGPGQQGCTGHRTTGSPPLVHLKLNRMAQVFKVPTMLLNGTNSIFYWNVLEKRDIQY